MGMILRRQKEKTTDYSSNMKEGKKNMNLKKFLSIIVAGVLALSSMSFTVMAEEEVALPTAIVTELDNDDLTFAMNFKAVEPEEEQKNLYNDWYADFVLTVNKDVTFNANGGADGYLSGQYDAWSENWVNVPFENFQVKANTPVRIMDTAAKLMGQSGLKLTYKDVYGFVKEFNCGVFFEDSFLAANPDLEVTLELRMWSEDESESYTIGEAYVFEAQVPEYPTATVTALENEDLTFGLNFKAVEPTDEQKAFYDDWYADFVLTVNKDVTFNANGGADGYLSGQYDAWSENWINVPFEDFKIEAGESVKIMDTAAKLMGQSGLKLTYKDVYGFVKEFNCGVFFEDSFLAANPDLEVTLELRMWSPDERVSKEIGKSFIFEIMDESVEKPSGTVTEITKENADFALNFESDTLTQEQEEEYGNWEADFELVFTEDVVLNANGEKDGYISVCENGVWKNVPNQDVEVKAGEVIKVREFAKQYGSEGISLAAAGNNDFSFAVVLADEYLQQYPDFEAEATLIMTNPQNLTQTYQIDKTYTFKAQEFKANSISVEYRDVTEADAEGYKLYDIVLKSVDGNEINEFASTELTFDFECVDHEYAHLVYEVTAKPDFTLSQTGKPGEEHKYMFNCKGVDGKYEVSATEIPVGQIKVAGYGTFTLKTDDGAKNVVHATKIHDNIVDTFVVGGGTDGKTGKLVINDDTDTTDDLVGEIEETEIKHIQKTLTINVKFPNSVNENVAEYQDMKVTIAGANDTETINLADFTSADNKGYTITRELDQYFKYTVTVEGAGYRTASYTVTMDDNKTLNFWNNVMDDATEVEVDEVNSKAYTTFLAGDIVKDANINIYDLSAVVAYFGTTTNNDNKYSKYDLNRDGEIDSKNVAYVLVSWNK